MKLTIEHLTDNEDGSADVIVHMDEEGRMYLLSLGINIALKQAIDDMKLKPAEECEDEEDQAENSNLPPWAYQPDLAAEDEDEEDEEAEAAEEYVVSMAAKEEADEEADDDEAWDLFEHMHSVQARNRACMAAWEAAGMFISANAHRLGQVTLREAFEKGFLLGYDQAIAKEVK